jgi:hypothetical protein
MIVMTTSQEDWKEWDILTLMVEINTDGLNKNMGEEEPEAEDWVWEVGGTKE